MFQNARCFFLLFAATLFLTSTAVTQAQFPPPPPLSFVRQQDGWTLYSRRVNIPVCAAYPADHSGETWVGTALGIKRLAKDGTLLRLYTRSDGLPRDAVSALAVEPDEVWAIAPIGSGRYDLCRLDRKSDKWKTLREIIADLPYVSDWTSVPNFIATGSKRYVCFTIGISSFSGPWPTQYLFDRQKHTWQDISWRAAPQHFAVNWLYAQTESDGTNSLFFATDAGLVRYDIEQKVWQVFLSDRAITGGTAATDDSLLLATLSITDKRTLPPHARLQITHFSTRSNAIESDDIFPSPQSGRDADEITFPGPRRSVVEADDSIWLTTQHQNGVFVALPAVPEAVMRFDEQTHIWSKPKLDDTADIPAAVMATAQLSGYRIPDALMSRSLPGWISPTANLPTEASLPKSPSFPPRVIQGLLTYNKAGSAPVQAVSLPPQEVPLTPTVFSVEVAGDRLYALTYTALWSCSLHGGDWTEFHFPVSDKGFPRVSQPSCFESGGYLWVSVQNWRLWAFDPKTGVWAKTLPIAGNRTFIGAENGNAWFIPQYGSGLTSVSLLSGQAEDIKVVLPPRPQSLSPSKHVDPLTNQILNNPFGQSDPEDYAGTPFHVAIGKVWYATSPYSSEGSSTLRGYDPKTHLWTEPLHIAGRIFGFVVYATPHELYVSFGGRDIGTSMHQQPAGALYRFRSDTQQWENVAPGCPQWHGSTATPTIISVDDRAIWLADDGHHLWRWDRIQRIWNSYPSETLFLSDSSFGDNQPKTSAVHQGNFIYLTALHGLRRFNVLSETWTTLPFPDNATEFQVRNHVEDDHGVWAICEDNAGGSCTAHYDLATRKWMFFTPPQSQSSVDHFLSIVSDGDTGTVLEGPLAGNLYSLDPRTGQCQDLKPALLKSVAPGQDHVGAHVERMVNDGANIWVLATVRPSTSPTMIQPSTVLACWNERHGFTVYTIPEEAALLRTTNFWPGNILIQPESISLLLPGGIGRFLKADHSLQSLIPPSGFPTPYEAGTDTMTSSPDGSLWLIGRDAVMHWTEPSEPVANPIP